MKSILIHLAQCHRNGSGSLFDYWLSFILICFYPKLSFDFNANEKWNHVKIKEIHYLGNLLGSKEYFFNVVYFAICVKTIHKGTCTTFDPGNGVTQPFRYNVHAYISYKHLYI